MSTKRMSKIIALTISWILFLPLFLFLSIKWSNPKLVPRIILTVLAPFSMLIILFISLGSYEYYYFQIKRGSRYEIETKTGIEFPRFKTIKSREMIYGPIYFSSFRMEYSVQLDTTNIDKFYQKIENKLESENLHQADNISNIFWDSYANRNYTFGHFDSQENLVLVIDGERGVMRIIFGS